MIGLIYNTAIAYHSICFTSTPSIAVCILLCKYSSVIGSHLAGVEWGRILARSCVNMVAFVIEFLFTRPKHQGQTSNQNNLFHNFYFSQIYTHNQCP